MSQNRQKQIQLGFEVWQEATARRGLKMRIPLWRPFLRIADLLSGAMALALLLCIGAGRAECRSVSAAFPEAEIAPNSSNQELGADHPANTNTRAAASPGASPDIPRTDLGKKIQSPPPDPNAYIIGEQDSLMITVWKEKEISGSVVVRPDGKITVPLAGEIRVVGMTPVQLQGVLAEKLKPFVTVPQVTVAVTEIRSRKVYLIGHAAREGQFAINSSTSVLQIIAQAGGLKDFAKRKKIYILRQQGNGQTRFSFNYDDVIRGRKMQQNILLEPGDTIVVP
jgi:polysaccharide export outer membrane protein